MLLFRFIFQFCYLVFVLLSGYLTRTLYPVLTDLEVSAGAALSRLRCCTPYLYRVDAALLHYLLVDIDSSIHVISTLLRSLICCRVYIAAVYNRFVLFIKCFSDLHQRVSAICVLAFLNLSSYSTRMSLGRYQSWLTFQNTAVSLSNTVRLPVPLEKGRDAT